MKIKLCLVMGMLVLGLPGGQVAADQIISSVMIGNKVADFASGLFGKYSTLSRNSKRFNITNTEDSMRLLSVTFRGVRRHIGAPRDIFAYDADADIEPAVIGEALVYPNPFRQSTRKGGQLGYELSKNMSLVIHVYDMLGRQIVKRTFNAGAVGGRKGYNKLDINSETLNGHVLSAGVYFYLLIHEGTVLSRGKMAIKP